MGQGGEGHRRHGGVTGGSAVASMSPVWAWTRYGQGETLKCKLSLAFF